MESKMERPRDYIIKQFTILAAQNGQILNKNIRKYKKKIALNLSLIYLIPKFLVLFAITLFWDFIDGPDFSNARYWIISSFLIGSIALIIILSHVRLKNPKKSYDIGDEYIRKGWFVIKLSHHDKNRLEHEIKIGGKFICSGCFGSAIGLILGGIIGIVYVTNFGFTSKILGIVLIYLGFFTVSISFSKYVAPIFGAKRFLFNVFSTVGLWIIIVGSDLYFGNLMSLIFYAIVIPFLFYERIYLTHLDHKMHDMTNGNSCV